MAAGGTGGSVTDVTTNAAGVASVTVHFPAKAGPPPVEAHDETYNPCPDPWLGELKRVQDNDALKVDTTVNSTGGINGTSVHK